MHYQIIFRSFQLFLLLEELSNIIFSYLLTLTVVQNLVISNQLNPSNFVIQRQLLPSHSPESWASTGVFVGGANFFRGSKFKYFDQMLVLWHKMLVFWPNFWPNDQIQEEHLLPLLPQSPSGRPCPEYHTAHYIILRHFIRQLHLKWPKVHQQSHYKVLRMRAWKGEFSKVFWKCQCLWVSGNWTEGNSTPLVWRTRNSARRTLVSTVEVHIGSCCRISVSHG